MFSWDTATCHSISFILQLVPGETVSNWAGDNFLTQNTDAEIRINELQKPVWSRQGSLE